MKRVLLCAALLAWSGMASAVVYKWVDSQGKVQYGDTPPDGVHAEIVPILGSHSSSTPPAPSTKPVLTPQTVAPKLAQDKQAVAQDVASSKEKECADARVAYQKLIEGRRIYKTDDNGQRIYLSSEEIDAQRLTAKQAVDDACTADTP
jgi:hypothetical protein